MMHRVNDPAYERWLNHWWSKISNWHKAKGLSLRKSCAVLRDCFGLQLSPGGLSQALDRLAAKVKPQYDAIATELRQAPALHSDETSWWVAGPGWWPWVFYHPAAHFLYRRSEPRA